MRTGTHSEASHTGEALSTGLYLRETGPRSYASQEAGFPQAPHRGGTVGKTGLSKTCGVRLCFGDRLLEWVRVRIQNTNCYEQLLPLFALASRA
jgi:hypothetical protein